MLVPQTGFTPPRERRVLAHRISRLKSAVAGELRSRLRPLHGGFRDVPGMLMERRALKRWDDRVAGRPHGLPKPLIVSLTSYPPRFPTLSLTLKCLLTQSLAPDRVMLWVTRADFALLPQDVLDLCDHGLEIAFAPEWRSFKKLVPAIAADPDAFIVTVDDDVSYARDWLATLVARYRPGRREVIAARVHRIMLDTDGQPLPYARWRFDIKPGPASPRNLATGVGGILYPPGSLHADATNADLFMQLCPTHDDLWFYMMARRAGCRVVKAGPRQRFISWAGSQQTALQHANVIAGGGNDVHFRRLIEHFGAPFGAGETGLRTTATLLSRLEAS